MTHLIIASAGGQDGTTGGKIRGAIVLYDGFGLNFRLLPRDAVDQLDVTVEAGHELQIRMRIDFDGSVLISDRRQRKVQIPRERRSFGNFGRFRVGLENDVGLLSDVKVGLVKRRQAEIERKKERKKKKEK